MAIAPLMLYAAILMQAPAAVETPTGRFLSHETRQLRNEAASSVPKLPD